MKLSFVLWTILVYSAVAAAPVCDHGAMHTSDTLAAGDVGMTHFENSGAPRAQRDFLRGLLFLHSFEYRAARSAFQRAESLDPKFAMAYWGEALTHNQTLWGEQDVAAARAALAKLDSTAQGRASKLKTAREGAYFASVELLYGSGDKALRDEKYSMALGVLARKYPDDLDARSLYALSILGLTGGRRDVANYMRAAAEAEAVYDIDNHHPGALHYLIHAYDDPIHAPLGLRAARLYGKVAPAASHAQHMPSHIFFALGMWDDAIEANLASLNVARAEGDGGYHSLLWLTYAYLQENKQQEAEQLIRSVAHDVDAGATKENRIRLAYARATWLVETQGAAGPEARLPVDSNGIASIGYFTAHDFARGITSGADMAAARMALAQLRSRTDAARAAVKGVVSDWHDTVTPEELEHAGSMATALDGTIQYTEGARDRGIALVREAISAADHVAFEYGPPWSAKPLEELLGELLLKDGRREEAVAAFKKALAVYPNRRLALDGLKSAQAIP